MTNYRMNSVLLAGALVAVAHSANATQPPDSVQSDARGNTAMGYDAMVDNTSGFNNTASGYEALFSNVSGSTNVGVGYQALFGNTIGTDNTAVGIQAMYSNTGGYLNTAVGREALYANTLGFQNTAVGQNALGFNTTGDNNTATGGYTMNRNTVGNFNTASGFAALYNNTAGNNNTAAGYEALFSNLTGSTNSAYGYQSLYSNTTGSQNAAVGQNALYSNTTGSGNVAVGYSALYYDTTGYSNLAFGFKALFSNSTGENNIGVGNTAGYNVKGSYNIEIGSQGVATDNHVIRIGAPSTQSAAYVAGISGTQVTGAAVYVTPSGQLGVLASSERYKNEITSLGVDTEKLNRLRPVTFHLKSEPRGALQYGLIAEEVDKIYPELVIRDDAGVIQGVRYDELAPILLKEVQQQNAKIKIQAKALSEQAGQFSQVLARVAALQRQNDAIQAKLANLEELDRRRSMVATRGEF